MALFKILKGTADNLPTTKTEGYCYVTTDTNRFYIDLSSGAGGKRIELTVANADKLTTPRNIQLTGAISGQVLFDGSKDISIETSLSGDIDMNGYLPLSAGEDKKLTGPLGLTENVMYGTELPSQTYEGQLFFLEDDGASLPGGGNAGDVLIKNSATYGDAIWKELVALPKGGTAGQSLVKSSSTDGDAVWKDSFLKLTGGTVNGNITINNTSSGLTLVNNTSKPASGVLVPLISGKYQNSSGTLYGTTNLIDFIGSGETDAINNAAVIMGSNSGTTIIRSGEGCHTFAGNNNLCNNENIYAICNGSVYFYTGTANDGTSGTKTMSMTKSRIDAHVALYGAVWNDYAEYRSQEKEIKPGYCVRSSDSGRISKTDEMYAACDGVVSDTFGFAIGETDECKTPLAVAGRVLAYCSGNPKDFHAGDTVCAGPGGLVYKMSREEIVQWPDRIVGIVSEIPDYDTWGTGNVKVDGRIWIKIK